MRPNRGGFIRTIKKVMSCRRLRARLQRGDMDGLDEYNGKCKELGRLHTFRPFSKNEAPKNESAKTRNTPILRNTPITPATPTLGMDLQTCRKVLLNDSAYGYCRKQYGNILDEKEIEKNACHEVVQKLASVRQQLRSARNNGNKYDNLEAVEEELVRQQLNCKLNNKGGKKRKTRRK